MGLFSIFSKTDNLYFPGCTTYFKFPQNYELYKKIFSKLGIIFKTIEPAFCSGLPALEAGYDQEARKIARKNFERFQEEDISTIITNSPEAYKVLLQDYPEMLPDWDIEIRNIWELILEKLKDRPGLIRYFANEAVTYQDSCYLGRYCKIYDEPREILSLLGYNVKELLNSRSHSICCGSCGGLPVTDPELADEIAKEKILQVKRIGVRKVIVASMKDYELLKKNSKDSGVEVLELSEVLGIALGLKPVEDKQEERVIEIVDVENKERIGEIEE